MATAAEPIDDPKMAQIQAELQRLADSDASAEQFFKEFLLRVMDAVDAIGASAWALSRQGLLAKLSEVGESPADDKENAPAARQRLQCLLKVLHGGTPHLQPPRLFSPLLHGNNCVGALELTFPENVSAPQVEVKLQFVSDLSTFASRYLARQVRAEPTADHPEFVDRLEQFVLRLGRHVTSEHVAMTVANEGRQLLGCDRVSVAMRRGEQARVLAVSGQERVVHRSNMVRCLTDVATSVLVSGRAIQFTGEVDDLPPQIEELLVEYLAESGARRLEAIPLREPADDEDDADIEAMRETYGVLIIERFSDSSPTVSTQGLDKFTAHVAQALVNAQRHERIFLLPLWRAIGNQLAPSRQGKWSKTTWIALIAAAGLALLAILPVPYRVEAEGRLVPVEQRRAFSPLDGEVVEVYVRGGQQVQPNEPLLRLHDDELAMRALLVRNELMERKQLLTAQEAESDQAYAPGSHQSEIRLRGRITQTRIEIEGLRRRLLAVEQQQANLIVRSPISGTVATFEPEQLLVGRPVTRGQLLVEIMDEAGPWCLELDVPAHRLGHIRSAQSAQASDELPVRFVLATMPEHTFDGTVDRMSTRTTVNADRASVISCRVAIDASEMESRTVGSEVVARIYCGRRSLAYVLFGDVAEYLKKRIW